MEVLRTAAPSPEPPGQDVARLRDLSARQWKTGVAAWLGWLFDGLDMHLYVLVAAPFVAELLGVDQKDPQVGPYSSYIQAAFLVGWALGGAFFGRVADRPFAADAQGGQEPEDEQLPPGPGEERQAREGGVGEDRQRQRPAAPHAVGDAPEEAAAQRPADQESGLDHGTVGAHQRVFLAGDAQQLGDEGGGHQHVEVHGEPVEQPAQPGREAGLPLPRRQAAQGRHLTAGR